MDTEWVFIDGSYIRIISIQVELGTVKIEQLEAQEADQLTKIHLATTDANGYPLDFEITGGEVHDSQVAPS